MGRFYVYDDRSQPPLQEALQRYIDAGVVVYRLLVGGEGAGYFNDMQQLAVYRDCVRHHGHRHKWLGERHVHVMHSVAGSPAAYGD